MTHNTRKGESMGSIAFTRRMWWALLWGTWWIAAFSMRRRDVIYSTEQYLLYLVNALVDAAVALVVIRRFKTGSEQLSAWGWTWRVFASYAVAGLLHWLIDAAMGMRPALYDLLDAAVYGLLLALLVAIAAWALFSSDRRGQVMLAVRSVAATETQERGVARTPVKH